MPGLFHSISIDEVSHWPTPNYLDPVERRWLPAFAIGWLLVSTLLVFGRLVLKWQKRAGSFGVDDLLIFVAWVFAVAFSTLACIGVWNLDIGRHIWDVRPNHYEPALYVGWLAQVMFIFSTGATKASVLAFYVRIVKDTYSPAWLYLIWTLQIITCASWLGAFMAYCFMCTPLSAFWSLEAFLNGGFHKYHCINGDDFTIAIGVITIASDFWTAAVPCALFQYHDLGLPRRQRIMLNIIFCLGFIVTGVGIARTYYLWKIGHHQDLSWIGYNLFTTSMVEVHLSIHCTCAPFLRAVVRRYFPDVSMSMSRSRSRSTPLQGASSNLSNLSHRVSSTWRQSTLQKSYTQELKDMSPADDVIMEDVIMEEKSGCLVKEAGTGRLVYSAHVAKPSETSLPGSQVDFWSTRPRTTKDMS